MSHWPCPTTTDGISGKGPSTPTRAPKSQSQPQSSLFTSQIMPLPQYLIPDYPIFDYPRSLDKDEPGQAGTVPLSQVSHDAVISSSQ